MQQNIPSIDLHDFTKGDVVSRKAFIEHLGNAYENIGFVAVKNHGLSNELIAQLYSTVENFFALPEKIKAKYDMPGLAGQRGYTPFGREHAKGQNTGDLKEFWQMGQFNPAKDASKSDYPPNPRVEEVADFYPIAKEVFETLEKAGTDILRAIALYLGLDEGYFDKWVLHGNSVLRAIHYPPITAEPNGAVRAAEHEDINLITLLMGASAEGLQILNKQNEWVDVTALPNQIIVNVGDMLQRVTNNKLRSTTHRVINPSPENRNKSRYSIPFFLHPRLETPLNCIPECVDENHPKLYEDISTRDFLYERLREIGLKT